MDLHQTLDHVVDFVGFDCTETVLENAAEGGSVVAAQSCTEDDGIEEVFLL